MKMKFIDVYKFIKKKMIKNKMDIDYDRYIYLNILMHKVVDSPLSTSQRQKIIKEIEEIKNEISNKEYDIEV